MVPSFQQSESIADYYRRRADEARCAAKNSASDPRRCQALLELAEQWSRLEARYGVARHAHSKQLWV
jgi:hypothetical protein